MNTDLPELLRAASRQQDNSTSTALTPQYEDRLIVLAQGIQFQNPRLGGYAFPDYLVSKLGGDIVKKDDNTITYISDKQHVNFTVTRVTTKKEFQTALATPNVHVIYAGHARHGQGPCFGDNDAPGEDWGNGTDKPTSGLFRAGFPYVSLPVKEILEHQYTVRPVRGDEDKPAAADCHPWIRYRSMRKFALSELSGGAVFPFLGGPPVQQNDTFWAFHGSVDGDNGTHLVVHADWTNSDTTPYDVGGTNMQCRVFCCVACSTFRHNYPIVRKRKAWTRTDDDHFAYWTTHVTYSSLMAAFYLHRVLAYPKRNDFENWKGSLKWAVAHANQDYVNINPDISSQLY